jgi:hypothetical protein
LKFSEQAVTGVMYAANLIAVETCQIAHLNMYREGLEWEFFETKSDDDAVDQAATLAAAKAADVNVIIITTSIELCEKVANKFAGTYSG